MDLNNYWQENKRFATGVVVGVALFAIGWYAVDHYLGAELRGQRSALSKVEGELKEPLFSNADLDRAREDNQALIEACNALRQRIEFAPRPEFKLEKGVAATNRYFSVLERTRDDLRTRAGRAGVTIPEDLGMPAVAPTKEIELARHLEALDAIEQVVRLTLEAGVARLASIRVKLDPRLLSGKPFEDMEKTHVELEYLGDPLAVARLLVLLQEPRNGRPLLVESAAVEPARNKASEVALEVSLLIAHLNRIGATEAAGDGAPRSKTAARESSSPAVAHNVDALPSDRRSSTGGAK